jgi:CDP-6-deoxy-D-xylo-4-hexulose-3-dehydrase
MNDSFASRALEMLGLKENMEGNFKYLANQKSFKPGVDAVYYSGPYWNHEEIEAAIRCLIDGKWLSSGESVLKFERSFSKRFNFLDSVMVNSGSSANLVMVAALKKYFGWKDGDEILVSVVGFPTTINPIIQNGLRPVFVDVSLDDLNWDLDLLSSQISNRTRAVFSSPVLGNPYDFDKLFRILGESDIQIVSDNCDSLGSKWRDKYLTDYSVASSCSFYPAHHITTMEGGMVSSQNKEIVKLARSFSWWGRGCYCVGAQNLLPEGTCKKRFSKWIDDCEVVLDHKYIFENIGYNLKPLDLQGAIGIVQLSKLNEIEEKRRLNKNKIGNSFSKIPGVRVLVEREGAYTSWFGVPIICDTKDLKLQLVSYLEKNKIQTRNYFAGNILQQPAYRELGDYRLYPNASRVLEEVFFVGCSPTISEEMTLFIDEVLEKFKIN